MSTITQIFRAGLISILKDQADLGSGGEAIDYASGLAAVRAKPFDLVIIDIGLGVTADGLELIKSIKAEQPDLHILIVSVRDESIYAGRCLRAGAGGYVMKRETTASLLEALRHVFSGKFISAQPCSSGSWPIMPTALRSQGLRSIC